MPFNPGGKARSFDNRDIKLGGAIPMQAPPVSYETDVSVILKLYQAHWPACGAHMGAHMKEVQELIDRGDVGGCSPRYLWRMIKDIDGLAYEDGTDMRSIFQALATKGTCAYASLPNPDPNTSLDVYSNPTLLSSMDEEAQLNVIRPTYGFLSSGFSLQDLRSAIYTFKVVGILIRCDDGFWGSKFPTFTTKKYGHFVLAYGYDENGIKVVDSTEIAIPLKYINNLYFPFIQEVGTTTDVPYADIKAMIEKISILTRIVNLYKQVIALKNQIKK